MRRVVFAAAVVMCGGMAWGQSASTGGSGGKGFDWSSLGDAARVAGEVRQAAEAVERAGGVLERIVAKIMDGAAEVSRNHAEASAGFDPLGYKAAMELIREQGQTIEELQKAEIRRLRRELRQADRPGRRAVRQRAAAKR